MDATGYQKNSLPLALDAAQKPYYCVSKLFKRQRRLATTALLGLAPARSTRASAAHHRKASALVGVMTWV
jgi:hypothetical protein